MFLSSVNGMHVYGCITQPSVKQGSGLRRGGRMCERRTGFRISIYLGIWLGDVGDVHAGCPLAAQC